MKKMRFVWLMLALMAFFAADAESQIFKNVASNKGVTYVYLPRSALNASEELEVTGVKTEIPIERVLSIEIIYAEERQARKNARNACEAILAKMKKTLLMETLENGEHVKIYTEGVLRNGRIMNAIIEVSTPEDYSLIYVAGEFNRNHLIRD